MSGRARVLVATLAAAAGMRPFVDYPPHGAAQAAVAATPVSSSAGPVAPRESSSSAPRESEYWQQREEQQRREQEHAQEQGQEQEQEQEQPQPQDQPQPRPPLPQNSSRRGVAGWSLDELNALFYAGAPSNSLRKAGLTIHSFDATEDDARPWRPCVAGWCAPASSWWSASIVNTRQRHTFGSHGLLLAPGRTRVLCSHWADAGTLEAGCETREPGPAMAHRPYPRRKLRAMLQRSLQPGMPYNEVLLDSKRYVAQLPASLAGIIYGLPGPSATDSDFVLPSFGADAWGQVQAANAYVWLLDAFNLTESDVFLLHANENFDRPGATGAVLTDHSRGAREFVRTHPYGEYRQRWAATHPLLSQQPEHFHQLA